MRISKNLKRISSVIVLIIYLAVMTKVIGDAIEPVSYAMYFNHDLECIEEQGRQVDMVLLGASRVYRTFVPEIIEEELGMDCVINAASAVQPMCGTYYQLEELIKRFCPKNVIIGLSWDSLTDDSARQRRLIVYDRLTGFTKAKYALNCFEFDEWLYLIDAYRFRSNFDIEKFREINDKKQRLIQADYNLRESADEYNEAEYYADKGFVYSAHSLKDGNIPMKGEGVFSVEDIDDENKKYLDDCVKLCRKNGINLYLVVGPTSLMRMYNIDNYQGADDYFSDYAKENGLIYNNLNYIKNRETILPDSKMFDYNHVSGEGAYEISSLYMEILKKEIQGIDVSDYFYDNMDELKADVNRVVSVEAEFSIQDSKARIEAVSLHNDDVIPLYQIEISEDGENYDVLKKWTKDSVFDIKLPDHVIFIKVKAKTDNDKGIEAYQVFKITDGHVERITD